MDKVLIFGHKNPDTDSVCASIALSYLKNKIGMDTEPRILGTISKETEYVLKRFKVSVPAYLNDVKVQLKDVNYHKNYIINENRTIYEAFNLMNNNRITGLPLVDNKRLFKGYVSLNEIGANMINENDGFINTSFDNILATLNIIDYLKIDEIITGNVTVVNDIKNICDSSIMIVPNYDIIQRIKLEEVKLIIILDKKKIPGNIKKLARSSKVNLVVTSESLFDVSRKICLTNPIKSIRRSSVTITFNEQDYLSDFNEETKKLKHTNYPIINNKNACLGMLRTIDAHEIKKKKVILVDHNTMEQSVDGLNEAEIIEIIDHHNLGDIYTSTPVNFRSMCVGSASTIIYYLFKENNVKIPMYIAGLLLSGIISDTLLLQSPTTSQIDRLVATDLAKIAKLDINKYGLELLSSGISIDGMSANDIVFKDLKTYKVNNDTIAIAQVFTTSFDIYKPRIEEIIEELNRISQQLGYKVCTLFITDFLTNDSIILYSDNSKKILELAYGIEELEQGYELANVVSRKKQMVPNIMSVVEHL